MDTDPGLAPHPAKDDPAAARQQFLFLFPSIMLPMFLAVVDQTIVATALPAIGASLGNVDRLSWIVVSYLVAATVTAPVYGRLGDFLGRRKLIFAALAIFSLGSLLCAIAQSIEMLTIARIVQGAGGGGLMTLSQALIGEAVQARERARYQGYLAAIAVASNAFGPVAGGFLTDLLGWRSVFFVNLPVALIAGLLALRLEARPGTGETFRFDTLGLVLFAMFIASTLILLDQVQALILHGRIWLPVLAVLAALSACILVWHEKRAASPLLPLSLLKDPAIWRADALAACHGAMLVSLITFMPFYLRMAHGASASQIGFLLLPMTAGIGLGSMATGRIIGRIGRTAIFPSCGLAITVAILIVIAFASPSLSAVQISWIFGVVSICMGTVMCVVQLTVQFAAGPRQLGAGAASVQFSRSLGAAVGAAAVGTVLFATLAMSSPEAAGAFAGLLQSGPDALMHLSGAQQAVIRDGIGDAFRNAFLCIAWFGAMAMTMAWTLPIRRV